MSILQAVILGLVQGLTEFFPVSSSGHLILAPAVLGFKIQSLSFDVALHIGTLFAILFFFKAQIKNLFTKSGINVLVWIIIATVPAALAGLYFGDFIEEAFRNPLIVIINSILWGVVLWFADLKKNIPEKKLNFAKSSIIGLAQAIALIPGTSRSGITISAGLFLGLSREEAFKFSFLLSIPVILGAAVLKGFSSNGFVTPDLPPAALLSGIAASFASGLFALFVLKKVAERFRFWPFALYRIILGIILLIWLI